MRIDPVEAFWERFTSSTGVVADFDAWAFGDENSPDLADELAYLVLHGPKRATTCLYEDALADNEIPVVGGYSVVLDGSGAPVCIIRTTEVDIVAFGDVDDGYAWDEGEGDRSLAFWRQAHIDFFAQSGHTIDNDTLVVLERFDLMWPPPDEIGVAGASPLAEEPVVRFFDAYAAQRSAGDVAALVDAHSEGSFALRGAEIVRHDGTQALERYYQRITAAERSADEHVWTIDDLVFEYPAERAALAVVRWAVRAESGAVLRTVDVTYVLADEAGRWRILGEIEHD
ncbi:MAG: ASCH domain-containing protein [Actinomycetota bacterium]|nr:ASCH domain-containing protein [Actinomycetota bacterium]